MPRVCRLSTFNKETPLLVLDVDLLDMALSIFSWVSCCSLDQSGDILILAEHVLSDEFRILGAMVADLSCSHVLTSFVEMGSKV